MRSGSGTRAEHGLMEASRASVDRPGGWSRDRRAGRRRLFGRGFVWGLGVGAATGAAVGGVIGLLAGLDGATPGGLGLALVGAGYGVVLGLFVAAIPSLVGAAAVTELISCRHPDPVSEDEVKGDLRLIFGAIVAVLNGALLIAISVGSDKPSSVVAWLPFLAAINAAMVPMLWRARQSLGRFWFEATR